MKYSYLKIRLLLGTVSLIVGLLATSLAMFAWHAPDGFLYLLGEYARYACAYGGFAAIIFGAMLINDFLVWRTLIVSRRKTMRNATAWLIRARIEWQLAKDFKKYSSMQPKLPQLNLFLGTDEEIEVVAKKQKRKP